MFGQKDHGYLRNVHGENQQQKLVYCLITKCKIFQRTEQTTSCLTFDRFFNNFDEFYNYVLAVNVITTKLQKLLLLIHFYENYQKIVKIGHRPWNIKKFLAAFCHKIITNEQNLFSYLELCLVEEKFQLFIEKNSISPARNRKLNKTFGTETSTKYFKIYEL